MPREVRLLPDKRSVSGSRVSTAGLPDDLLTKAVHRLRSTALVYAFVYFMAGFFPLLIFADERARLFESVARWGPGTVAIAVALAVAAVVGRVSPQRAIVIGLVFEVASSYGIARAEFLIDPLLLDPAARWVGLSWVAAWVVIFTVVVPARPSHAMVAALASLSAPPVMAWVSFQMFPVAFTPTVGQFFFWFFFPYVLVGYMAYTGARNVYGLGSEVVRARELGSYRLVEPLAQGGMGEVWRADHRLLARPAAIKLIRPSLDANADVSADARRRFEREAQVTARLRSPHTIGLFDFGVADDGSFYYAMELLEGIDADALVKRFGPIPASRAIHLLRQVCNSLAEAHSYDLVHRDIKPANIFLCRYGGEYDFVKVLDFGIVKTSRSGGVTETGATLTVDNGVTGTPAFIAPEQALGNAVDSRADIYATGCVAYWLLTGELVFQSNTPVGMMVQHAQTPPTAPSARSEMPIPAALDQLVLECLAKNPAERPQTAKELSRRLGQVAVASEWTEGKAQDWWSLHQPDASS